MTNIEKSLWEFFTEDHSGNVTIVGTYQYKNTPQKSKRWKNLEKQLQQPNIYRVGYKRIAHDQQY